MEFLNHFEIKDVGEDGTFNGIASVYGVEDLSGDVIEKGAFKKTIAENPTVPILWQHKSDEVIGEGTVKEWQGKIVLEGRLDLEDPTALKAYRKLKARLIKGLSIGYQTVKSSFEAIEDNGASKMIRRISELKLWEVSVVTFPMLPSAQVTRVKSTEDLEARLAALENELKALRAEKATPIDPGAGEGEGAAEQKTDEPDALHSMVVGILRKQEAA